jgi:hypothetical protein
MTPLDKFVHAQMNQKMIVSSDHKAINLRQIMEILFVDNFIKRWNEKFDTEIQTLEQIANLLKDSEHATFSEDGRTQFLERVRLSREARSDLLAEILVTRPWNFEAWNKISSCRDIPSLLEVQLIKLMIKLMNMETVYIPTVQAQVEYNE